MREIVKIDELAYFEYYLIDQENESGQSAGAKKPQASEAKKPLLLIMPGGAYLHVSEREGEPVAKRANAAGMHAVVLNYTVLPMKTDLSNEELLKQVGFCLDRIEQDAERFGIDLKRIYVMGFSAGGHLAAWSSIRFHERIAKAVLAYGAIAFKKEDMQKTMQEEGYKKQEGGYTEEEKVWGLGMIRLMSEAPIDGIDQNTPPTFLFHTADDDIVPCEQSLRYAAKLIACKVPAEVHVYEKGGHGLSLADESSASVKEQILPRVAGWFDLAADWLLHA